MIKPDVKVDVLSEIQKGLADLDIGAKFESNSKTIAAFARGIEDNRTRRDWQYRQTVNSVVFDVFNVNMQDDDYVLNDAGIKLKTVSDKYCFFKSLLNVCRLPDN
jgi:hypothetical protein